MTWPRSPVYPLFSPDGKWLAVLTQLAGERTWNYPPDAIQSPDTSCEVILYYTGQFQVARRFHFEDGNFATFSGQSFAFNPRRLAFSPDGHHFLIGCDGAVLIECSTGKIVRQFDVK